MTQQSEARLAALLAAAVDAIIVINQEGKIKEFNPAAEAIFGYTKEEILDQPVHQLMPHEYSHHHQSYVENYLAGNKPKIIGIGREVTAQRKDGSIFPAYLAVGEILGSPPTSFIGIMRDISDRVKAEQEAREHREALAHVARIGEMGEMTAGIAHEINQPLSAIATYAQACQRMINNNQYETADLLSVLEKIGKQAQRAGDIINRLRSFVNKRESLQEVFNPNNLVEEVVRLAETDARAHNISIELLLEDNLPPVQADPIQVQQVLLNLIRNGMEATPKPTTAPCSISVKTSLKEIEDEQFIEFSVTDSGTGLSEDALHHIFHPFYTTKSAGMGLGLSISHNIIHSHGGELRCHNNETIVGRNNGSKGATFYFTLPVALDVIE